MLKWFILISTVIEIVKSQCSNGCAKCNSNNSCVFCDFTNNYFLNGTTCALSKSLNCALVDLTGNCLLCPANQYLDPITANCLAVPGQNTVFNCLLYSNKGVCSVCANGFFLSQGVCSFITTAISNCAIYASSTTCQVCNPGYFASSNGQSCLQLQSDNCGGYSQIVCSNCTNGYIKSSYGYLKSLILGNNFNLTFTRSLFSVVQSNTINTFALPSCVYLPNCTAVNANLTCAACSPGTFMNLTTNLCQPNPTLPPIQSCQLFSIYGTCMSCLPGYFLANNMTCTAISPITNCQTYDTTANFTLCTSCQNGYYMTIFGGCAARINPSITGCLLLSSNQDLCQTCLNGYNLTSDSLACLQFTANCGIYQASTKLSTAIVCTTCINGFYLATNATCLAGNVSNCLTYSGINICSACLNGFILQNQLCIVVTAIPGCKVYSTTINNVCSTCNSSSVLVRTTGNCVNYNNIPLCSVYNSLTTCSQCQNGASLTSPSTCTSIAVASCATYNLATCIQCAAPNIFDQITGNCRSILQTYYQNCVPTMINGTLPGQIEGCNVCQQNSIFFNYKNGAFCFEISRLTAFNGGSLDANCAVWKYQLSSNNFICVQCKPNFFLNSGTCTSTCSGTIYPSYLATFQTIGIYNMNQTIFFSYCGTSVSSGCYIAGFNLVQSSLTPAYSCVMCNPGLLVMVTMSSGNALAPVTDSLITQITPVSNIPVVSCSSTSSVTLGVLNATNLVPSCDYYYALPGQTTTGCLKCTFGMSGVVLNYIGNCFSFTGSLCNRCRNFYFLASSTSCLPVIPVNNCLFYDGTASSTSCVQCSPNFWVSAATTCSSRTYLNALCLVYNLFADQCVTCDSTQSYITGNTCTAGTVTNCNSYSQSAVNTCIGCSGARSVAENQCVTTLTGLGSNGFCMNVRPSNALTCFSCQYNAFQFTIRNRCAAITTVANCQTYISTTLCGVCNNGFTLSANQLSCTTTTASLNCLTYSPVDLSNDGTISSADWISGNVFLYSCTLCAANFLMVSTATSYTYNSAVLSSNVVSCIANPFDYVKTNCQADNAAGGLVQIQNYACGGAGGGCKTGFSPFIFETLTLCVLTTYVQNVRTATIDANCKIYVYSSGTYQCSVCNFGYGLESGACVAACTGTGAYIALKYYIYDTATPPGILIGGENVCITPPAQTPAIPANCLIIAPEFVNTGTSIRYACVKCAATYNPVIQTAFYNNILTAYDFNNLLNTQIGSPITAYPSIAVCVTGTAGTNYTLRGTSSGSDWPPVANCKYMYKLTSTNALQPVIGCFTCNPGFSGPIVSSSGDTNHYINACSTDAALSTTQPYTGFQNNDNVSKLWGSVSAIFGSTTCVTSTNTPVVYRAIDSATGALIGLNTYTKPTTAVSSTMITSVQTSKDTVCVSAATASALTNIGVSAVPFTNCALILVNVQGVSLVTNTGSTFINYNPFCLACLPGFLPTFSSTFSHVITACTAFSSPTCPSAGTNLNSCNCILQVSSVLSVLSINFQLCTILTAASFPNCFAATNSTTCALCNPGYNVNSAGQCVNLAVSTCSSATTYNNDYYKIVTKVNNYYPPSSDNSILYFNNMYQGCQSCASSSYVMVNVSRTNDAFLSNQVCATNNNIFSFSALTSFDTNCQLYGFNSTNGLVCSACNTNFILKTTANPSCVAQSSFTNCNTVSGTTNLCVQCNSGYMLVNNLCVLVSSLSSLCSVWDTVNSVTSTVALCLTCINGYLLSSNSQTCSIMPTTLAYQNCVMGKGTACTVCSPGYVLTSISTNPSYCFPLSTVTTGSYDHDPNCNTLLNDGSTFAFANSQLTCNQCKTNFILSNTPSVNNWCYKFFASSNPEPTGCINYFTTQPALSSLSFSCAACPIPTYFLTGGACSSRTTILNCQTYSSTTNTCAACSPGYFLASSNTVCTINPLKNFLSNPSGFINQCSAISDCTSGVWLSGLTMPISGLFSCHQCNTAGNIPFVAIDGGTSYSGIRSLLEYNFNVTGVAPLASYIGGQAVFCANPTAANFNIPSGSFTFPTNCALGVTNINAGTLDASHSTRSTSVDPTKIAVFCVACKPGFTAAGAISTSSSTVSSMVSSCTSIANCVGTSWFNLCSQCQTNYAYLIASNGIINYASCLIFSQDPNCLVIQQINSVYSCKICRLGYFMNVVGSCEVINAPLCNSVQFDNGFDGVSIFTGLAWQKFAGCSACSSNTYLPTIMINNTNVCHQSNYLISNPTLPFPLFPRNCVSLLNRMEIPGYILCGVCSPNWYLNIGNSCISTMPGNCVLPVNTTYCSQCQSTFLNINGTCTAPSILGCTLYVMTISPYQICLVCAPTYYLSNNLCILGTISNCTTYSTPLACSGCAQGYGLISLINSTNYCTPIGLISNCATFEPSQFNQFSIACLTCAAGAIPQSLPTINQQSTCIQVPNILNCVTYDISSSFSVSSYNCTSCSSGFYLSGNTCIARNNSALFCQSADPKSDNCWTCMTGYNLNLTQSCVAPPPVIGAIGCATYDSSLNCLACSSGFYLSGNICLVVNSTSLLTNCLNYSSTLACVVCNPGYYINILGGCSTTSATNCLTAIDVNTCSSCFTGYGLYSSNGLVNCVQINISFCISISSLFPYNCLLCAANFYPTQNGCAQVVNSINNCLYYSADGVCQTCTTGYALATNFTCILMTQARGYVEPNCQSFNFYQSGTCTVCAPGYYFKNNGCVLCTAQNCLICDPSNPTNCLVCQPGSYQVSNGTCINPIVIPIQPNTTGNITLNQTNFTKRVRTQSPEIWFWISVMFILTRLD